MQNKRFELAKTNPLKNQVDTFYTGKQGSIELDLRSKDESYALHAVHAYQLPIPTNKQHQRRMAPIAVIQGVATSSQRGAGASGRKRRHV